VIDPRVRAAYHLEHWGSGNLHASMKHNMVLGSAVPTGSCRSEASMYVSFASDCYPNSG
jgi:hypothetical protein